MTDDLLIDLVRRLRDAKARGVTQLTIERRMAWRGGTIHSILAGKLSISAEQYAALWQAIRELVAENLT